MYKISIQMLEYIWWKKDSKLWTVSLVIIHDNTFGATIIIHNLFINDGLEKAVCAPLWSVHIIYTLKSPVDFTHACRHDKHVQTAPLCIHTQVDNYPDWLSHCFHSFNCSIIIPWRKYFCVHNNVDKYFDDLDDQLNVNAVSIRNNASSLPHFLFNQRWQILVLLCHYNAYWNKSWIKSEVYVRKKLHSFNLRFVRNILKVVFMIKIIQRE